MKRGHLVLISLSFVSLCLGGGFLASKQLFDVSNSKPPASPMPTKPSPTRTMAPRPTPMKPEATPSASPSPGATTTPAPTTSPTTTATLPSCIWNGTLSNELPAGVDMISGRTAAWTRYQRKFGNAVAGGYLPGTVAFAPAQGPQNTCAIATTSDGVRYRLQLVEFEDDQRDISQMAKDYSGDPSSAEVKTEDVPGAKLAQVLAIGINTKVNVVRSDDGTVLVVVASIDTPASKNASLQESFFKGSGAAFVPPQ